MKRAGKKITTLVFKLRQNAIIRLLFILSTLVTFSSIVVLYFEYRINPEQFSNWFDSIWWAIVTITTVGYGEKIPVSIPGKIIGIATMIFGMGVGGMVSGKIASFFVEKNLREGRGLGNYSQMKKHFVICGWKRSMDKIVNDVLLYNSENLTPSDIIIITNVDQHFIDNFRNTPGNEKVKIIKGESFNEEVLARANIKNAMKVMVLATDVGVEKPDEIDSKAIMTVMTLKNIVKGIYVIAELLDKSYEKYLKLAGCDEILLSQEYSRILLANASASSGMSHIVYDILDAQTPAAIATKKIPDSYDSKTFKELSEYFSSRKKILIGILENTGNAFTMKKEALREAQKSPDISMIVKNLKEAKDIQINRPLINPGDNYELKSHDMAIIIESREGVC